MSKIQSKFFLDSGNPQETSQAIQLLGQLDGQTTNPSLVAKNPELQARILNGEKFNTKSLLSFYKETVQEIAKQIPNGSVSIEVYADKNSTEKDLLTQAEEMFTWIPNAHIKFPTVKPGLAAAEKFVAAGGRVNMTLVFSQQQALAVHLATKSATYKGQVFVSPFIGRLDDIGLNGLDLVENILQMYQNINSKVEVLAASIRTLSHLQTCLAMPADIVTGPLSSFQAWVEAEKPTSAISNFGLEKIMYVPDLTETNWKQIDIFHTLTEKGLQKFADDWNDLLSK